MSTEERDARVDAAVAELLAAGGRPFDRAAWLARYPDLADELTEFLYDQSLFAAVASPIVAPTPGPQTTPRANDPCTLTYHGTAGSTVTTHLPAGGRFGDYELVDEIARGGMGVVYRATQRSLHRVVALKLIQAGEFADAGNLKRFRIEAEAAAHLDHPNIAPIYDVGEVAGQPFYAMRLVDGGTLAGRMDEYTLPKAANRTDARRRQTVAAGLIATVARAVHYAHQRGILHRDLKPANVLLDTDGSPHVTDFGLARRIGKDSTLTKTGAIVGTPSYMAPEQARGQEDVTTEADVYGLGAVLYHLLAGRPPFAGEDVLDTLYQVREREPARPRSVCREVDRDLETICLKCLDKEPGRRYQSAAALADDLERWQAGEPILARRAGPAERALKWARRNPAGAGLVGAGAVMVGALIGTGVALSYNARLSTAKTQLESSNEDLRVANDNRAAALAELELKNSEAGRLKTAADAEREKAQSLLYVARFRQAQEAWQQGRPGLATSLLFDTPETATLRRFAGVEEVLSGIGRVQVRPLRVPWVKPKQYQMAEPTQTVRLADFTPDGQTAVLVHPNGAVSWWSVETGGHLAQIGPGQTGTVTGLRVTAADAMLLVSAPSGSEIRVFGHPGRPTTASWLFGRRDATDDRTGRHIEVPGERPVRAWGVSRDGARVAAVDGDGRLRVWSVADRKPVAEVREFGSDPMGLSADGRRVARGGAEPAVFCLKTAAPEWTLPRRATGLEWRAVAFRPDGQLVAAATDGAVELWVPGATAPLLTLGAPAGVTDLEFGPDGRSLLATAGDRRGIVWDAWGRPLATFVPDRPPLFRARAGSGGALFAAGGREHPLDVHRVRFGQPEAAVIALPDSAQSVSFRADGGLVTATLRDGKVGIWRTADGRLVCTLPVVNQFGYSRAAFSPDGRLVAVGSRWTVALCDATDGRVITELTAPKPAGGIAYVYDVAFSPDGNFVAAGTAGTASVWDVRTGRVVHTLREQVPAGGTAGSWTIGVRFSPDGRYLATGSGSWVSDGTGRAVGHVAVWDLQTGQQLFLSPGQPDGIYGLAWSPNGRWLASGSGRYQFGGPGGVHVWEPASGKVVFDLKGHTQCVWAVAFSPDGRRLISAGGPWRPSFPGSEKNMKALPGAGEVRVWDMGSGQELLSAGLHTTTVYGAAFAEDGRSFATAGWDKLIRVWKIEPDTHGTAGVPP
jgi:WD40 repeat protein